MTPRHFDFSGIHGKHHTIDVFAMDSTLQTLNGVTFSPVLYDLLDFLRAVEIIDRFTRRPGDQLDTRPRNLSLTLPVRDLGQWSSPEVRGVLIETLQFLTQDTWALNFVARTSPSDRTVQSQPLATPRPHTSASRSVGLFSGGLDSVAGTALHLRRHPSTPHVVVSSTGGHLRVLHHTTFDAIRKALHDQPGQHSGTLNGVGFQTAVQHANVLKHFADQEPEESFSQRSRGFRFICMGAVVARAMGEDTLHIYENGVGGINLSYTAATIGVDNTRSMHPRFIAMMQQFLSQLFKLEFKIVNPHWFHTKGQMCAELKHSGLQQVVPISVSCDSGGGRNRPTGLGVDVPHCGICSSCILRKMSVLWAEVPDTQTLTDVLAFATQQDGLTLLQRQVYVQMSTQAADLHRALAHPQDAFLHLMRAFPDLRLAFDGFRLLGMTSDVVKEGLVALYRQYLREWDTLIPTSEKVPA